VQGITLLTARVHTYFHPVHMALQTRTFFFYDGNLFNDSNMKLPFRRFSPTPLTSSVLGPYTLLSTLHLCFLDIYSLGGGFEREIPLLHSARHIMHRRHAISETATTASLTLLVQLGLTCLRL
jgi:hypothetical protein